MEDLVQLLDQGLPVRGRPGRGSARIRGKIAGFRGRMPAGLHSAGVELVRSIAGSAPVQAESLLAFLKRLAGHPVLGGWKPDLRKSEGQDDFLSDLQVFVRLFPRPGLAQKIFVVVEDGRVDAHLRHRYPGLESDMRPFVEDILAKRPALAGLTLGASLLDMLVRISLDPARRPDGVPAALRPVWRLVAERLAPAFAPGATPEDAAVAATEIYWFFQGLLKARVPLAGAWPADEAEGTEWDYLSGDALTDATFLEALSTELEGGLEDVALPADLDVPLEFRGETDLGQVQKGLQMAEHLESAAADDPTAGRQVIHNLVINADQAMPGGGKVGIAAENVLVAGEEHLPLGKDRYVRLSVEDHGIGISGKHRDRIFDPFYTTNVPIMSGQHQ